MAVSWPFFNYNLPQERIAQRPVGVNSDRANSRLLVAKNFIITGITIEDSTFVNFPNFLSSGDLVVLNRTRVFPARFFVSWPGKVRDVEILLLRHVCRANVERQTESWEALVQPAKKLVVGMEFELSASLQARVLGRGNGGVTVLLGLIKKNQADERVVSEIISTEGTMPIPPYIRKGRSDEEDRDSYQTVFANEVGSVAAPTAGLHFTSEIFAALAARDIETVFLTHHVGPGSFLPVRGEDFNDHKMPTESFFVSENVWTKIREKKASGNKIIAVGTTATRALETLGVNHLDFNHDYKEEWRETALFITPGYKFLVVDGLVTNFHQPRSTHLLLVAAFIGQSAIEKIYRHALERNYRFLSYGDAMLLIPERN